MVFDVIPSRDTVNMVTASANTILEVFINFSASIGEQLHKSIQTDGGILMMQNKTLKNILNKYYIMLNRSVVHVDINK